MGWVLQFDPEPNRGYKMVDVICAFLLIINGLLVGIRLALMLFGEILGRLAVFSLNPGNTARG